MHLIAPFLSLAAWWNMRRVRRATADFRRARFYATRAEQTLIAVGLMPVPITESGVPAVSALPRLPR